MSKFKVGDKVRVIASREEMDSTSVNTMIDTGDILTVMSAGHAKIRAREVETAPYLLNEHVELVVTEGQPCSDKIATNREGKIFTAYLKRDSNCHVMKNRVGVVFSQRAMVITPPLEQAQLLIALDWALENL